MRKQSFQIADQNLLGRREFLRKASAAALALSFPLLPPISNAMRMGVVVHSYWSRWNSKTESRKYPGFSNAIDLLEHCHELGAGGLQVGVSNWTQGFAKKVRDRREKLGLYLEGSIGLPGRREDVSRFEQEVIHAKEAGAKVLRTVASKGRRYEILHSDKDFVDAQNSALTSLQLAEPVLSKHKVKLAVENHKDWRAKEFVSMLQEVKSEWVGVTLDFGNSIALLEDPMDVIRTLLPYLFSTHVKDMGVEEYADGFLLSEVPLGTGILDLPGIVAMCRQQNADVTFSLEMITRDPLEIPCLKDEYWATFGGERDIELARALQMVRQHKFKNGLPRVSQLSAEDRLAVEEQNIVACLAYGRDHLGL
jgi:sugar phosphate isomerase/epimerase